MNTYMTIQGDTWDIIALKTMGNEAEMGKLITANIEHADTMLFSAGVKLVIPDVEIPTDELLPPWKRGVT